MSIPLDELIRYWQGRLPEDREVTVEEALFEDAATARRLDALASLDAGIHNLVEAGKVQTALTVGAVDAMKDAGLEVRTYQVGPGETVPCTVALEDFVVIRLRGEFPVGGRIDVLMEGTFEGEPPQSEHYDDVPVDRRTGELVFVYPGDRIRALPRSQFRYRVTSGSLKLGEFGLDHTPPSSSLLR